MGPDSIRRLPNKFVRCNFLRYVNQESADAKRAARRVPPMRSRHLITQGVFAAVMLSCIAIANQQVRPPAEKPGAYVVEPDSRFVHVDLVRLIDTAEVDYSNAHGTFADWNELQRAGTIIAVQKRSPETKNLTFATGPEVVPGWFLTIVVSRDGRNYQLSLRDLADEQCKFSFFSDPSGLVYQGNLTTCGT